MIKFMIFVLVLMHFGHLALIHLVDRRIDCLLKLWELRKEDNEAVESEFRERIERLEASEAGE